MPTETPIDANNSEDGFSLSRFLDAQDGDYERAVSEVRAGRKRTHWMWYVFPQLRGLGFSSAAQRYGISGADEARAYLAHDVLGPRLIAACEAALCVEGRSALEIFGSPDDLKLRSCATLFAAVSDDDSVFHQLLDKYYDGKSDQATLRILDAE